MRFSIVCCFVLLIRAGKLADPEWHLMHQSDYDLKLERANVVSFNRSYFSDYKLEFSPYNRTQRAIHSTFNLLVDLHKELKIHYQMYKWMSNEYRYFPITFILDLCTEVKRNSFGLRDMFKISSNIRTCPIQKGSYHIFNGLPDYTKYPPFIPRGRFMSDVKLFQNEVFLLEFNTYIAIVDKSPIWTK